ncbi:VPH2 [Candida pseudojiufengensis]|uniref:VPH2 n=1 Tax=Candida pseudojiufengensis TaxID=497109 RepID=UPI002224EBC7|nr:VPH2 [Candida pseudojiufengensis]KAI5961459.1 VPH2 [Candida pseudojiufengensis]
MTLFVLTDQLSNTIRQSKLPDKKKDELLSSDTISHTKLIKFYETFHPTPSLLQLIKQTKLHIPKYEQFNKPKTKEFIKQMEKLRLEAKEKEYQKLIQQPEKFETLYDNSNQEYISPSKAHKELKNQLTTIVNIFISVASVAYAMWYWTKSSWGLKDSYRVLLTIFIGLLVLIAEVVVYMGYLNKVEEAKIKELQKKEVKKIIKTFDFTS